MMESDKPTPRRIPALITFLSPFRMIESAELRPWETNIEQINAGNWDYVKLHEIAGSVDVGLAAPYHMVVGRDGAIALPPLPEIRELQKATEFFNKCLGALLVGGIYCEAVSTDNIDNGSIIDWKYIRVSSQAKGYPNRFHILTRQKKASPFEAIELLSPRTIGFDTIRIAMATGLSALAAVPRLSGEFLLKGVTGIARRDWGVGLSNCWIVVEQITSHLWDHHLIQPARDEENPLGARVDQLADSRTWVISTKHELLRQKGLIPAELLRRLYLARKARNELAHVGRHPTEVAAMAAFESVKELLEIVVGKGRLPFSELAISDHTLTNPFTPIAPKPINPQYWMSIPKLPGEEELEKQEAEARSSQ